MKNILFIVLFILISFTGFSQVTKYYVDAVNGNNSDDGQSEVNAWATLTYAVTQVTDIGDTIYMMAGTHTLNNSVDLLVGVHLMGAGVTSIIVSNHTSGIGESYDSDAAIRLISSVEGTNGNQTISYLKFDGNNLTGTKAINVVARSNVKIHHCTIVDFETSAIELDGNITGNNFDCHYSKGNEVYNCIINNCSSREAVHGYTGGFLGIDGQSEMLIHDNIFVDTVREYNGDIIDGVGGCLKNSKIFNNISYKDEYDDVEFNFHYEIWNVTGGLEVYNNEFYGGYVGIDLGGHYAVKGDSAYSWYIHHNSFILDSNGYWDTGQRYAIDLEGNCEDIIIAYNYIKNYANGIYIGLPYYVAGAKTSQRHKIYFNLFENIGRKDLDWGSAIVLSMDITDGFIDSIDIYNNTIICSPAPDQVYAGVWLIARATFTNINIKNNIIQNFKYAPIIFDQADIAGTLDNIDIEYNLYNGNGNDNSTLSWGLVPTNYTDDNNIIDNPDFVGGFPYSFSLREGSPAIDAGIDIGLPWVDDAPDIGAFEFGLSPNGNLSPGSIGTTQPTCCYNTKPAPLTQRTAPSGGTGEYTFQWQSSPNNTTWTNIPGANLSGYQPSALTESTYFRRTVTSGSYLPLNSSSVLITVIPQINSAQLCCDIIIPNNTSTNLSIIISGGTSPYTVDYTRNGASQPTINSYIAYFSTETLTIGVYTYALLSVVDANGCPVQDLGTSITVTVIENANLTPGSVGTDQSVCNSVAPDPLTQITPPSGGTGTYSYQWQNSSDNFIWEDINQATLSNYSPPALSDSNYYRRMVTSGNNLPVPSSSVLISVYPKVDSAQLYENVSIVESTSANFHIIIVGGISPFTINYTFDGIAHPAIDNYFSGNEISTGILTEADNYPIALTSVIDANGCETQKLGTPINIRVTGFISGVPNVFTPNGDGINDTWAIPSSHNIALIRIYNRNLKQIIEYTGSDPEWDGRDSNGTPMPAGAYLYVIEPLGGTSPLKGYISVVK